MQKTRRAAPLNEIADALLAQDITRADSVAAAEFPWQPKSFGRKPLTQRACLDIFLRDGFIDRYSGSQLVFPGALLAIGLLLPDRFPMGPTWKVGDSHEVFWELWPVVDHVIPVVRGGRNDADNLVTTSSTNNVAKGHSLPSELGWTLAPVPADRCWDGLVGWFDMIVEQNPSLRQHSQLKSWYSALRAMQ